MDVVFVLVFNIKWFVHPLLVVVICPPLMWVVVGIVRGGSCSRFVFVWLVTQKEVEAALVRVHGSCLCGW
ncbi:hypothetical protein LguiA_004431 [Lonicera macranthoides]